MKDKSKYWKVLHCVDRSIRENIYQKVFVHIEPFADQPYVEKINFSVKKNLGPGTDFLNT